MKRILHAHPKVKELNIVGDVKYGDELPNLDKAIAYYAGKLAAFQETHKIPDYVMRCVLFTNVMNAAETDTPEMRQKAIKDLSALSEVIKEMG